MGTPADVKKNLKGKIGTTPTSREGGGRPTVIQITKTQGLKSFCLRREKKKRRTRNIVKWFYHLGRKREKGSK